jgi:hypothetical protein
MVRGRPGGARSATPGATLSEQGYTYAELARMTRDAELVRVRRGAHVPAAPEPVNPRVAHLQLLEATTAQSSASWW